MAKILKTLAVVSALLMLSVPYLALAADDTTMPSDVENVEAFPGDGSVTLTWDPATDDTGVAGYYVYSGLSSVTEEGGSYTFGSTDVGDVTSYTMTSLSNGVTYYFAVTAYDEAGNESEFYSLEVESTPEDAETGDFTAPTVSDATAVTSTLVEVEFSEDVVLPDDAASAFSLESTDGTALEILDAYVSDDESIVFLVTDTQTAGAQYILTAGITVEDTAGNPIVSGTSDTAVFTGSSLEATEEDTDTSEDTDTVSSSDEFTVEVEDLGEGELELTFSQEVSVAEPEAFTIQLLEDASVEVDIIGVSIDEEDATMLTLLVDGLEPGMEYVLSIDETVLNMDGEALGEDAMSVEFLAKTLDLADLIAPEDVTNFIAGVVNETTANLSWTASANTAGDLARYMIYTSSDNGLNFGTGFGIAADLVQYQVSGLTPGGTYTFKVTAVDENGNESEGVLSTVTLPEAGPGMIGLGALSLLGAGMAGRRKKKN